MSSTASVASHNSSSSNIVTPPSIPVACIADIPQYKAVFDLVCGYMRKKSNEHRSKSWIDLSWKRRWFYISLDIPERGNYILSYRNKDMKTNLKAKRSFHLVGTKIVIHNTRTFSLQFPNQVLSFQCETDQDAYRWTTSLAHIIAVADLRSDLLSKISLQQSRHSLSSHFLTNPINSDDDSISFNTNIQSIASSSSGSDATLSSSKHDTSTRSNNDNYRRTMDEEEFCIARLGNSNDEDIQRRRSHSRSFTEVSPRLGNNVEIARRYQEKRDEIITVSSQLWHQRTNTTHNNAISSEDDSFVHIIVNWLSNIVAGILYTMELLVSFLCLNAVLWMVVVLSLVVSITLFWCNALIYCVLLVGTSGLGTSKKVGN